MVWDAKRLLSVPNHPVPSRLRTLRTIDGTLSEMWTGGNRGTCGLEAKAALMLDRDNRLAQIDLQLLHAEE